MRVLIIGAGGHGQVAADILLQMQQNGMNIKLAGFLDDNAALHETVILNAPVLGAIIDIDDMTFDGLFVGIGHNAVRSRLFDELKTRDKPFVTLRHPTSTVALGVEIGLNSLICAGVVIGTGTHIGHNVILNTGCTVDHHNRIEDHAHIAPGAHLGGDVYVGSGALIGMGATVMPQREIGAWAQVGAAGLVYHNVPDHTTVAGVPATLLHKAARNHRDDPNAKSSIKNRIIPDE